MNIQKKNYLRALVAIVMAGSIILLSYRKEKVTSKATNSVISTKNLVKEAIDLGAVVVDVRSAGEFASGSYAKAKNIPISEVSKRIHEFGDKTKTVVVFCASGVRSARAESILGSAGYTNVINAGGLNSLKVSMAQQ